MCLEWLRAPLNDQKELKEKNDSSTWFKDHMNLFTDTSLLGSRKIVVKNEEEVSFNSKSLSIVHSKCH